MKFTEQLLGLTLSLATLSGFAGNGSGGGGNIYGDQLNPWFLSNTPVVSYCVQIDPNFSALSTARVSELVAKALSFWTENMGEKIVEMDWSSQVKFGPRMYLAESSCKASTDIVFQMGFLTEAQKKEITSHKQLLGLAYRTDYDSVNLRGKGFIYIAPESGPSRPLATGMHATPWSADDGASLEWALVHEIGHTYGFQDDHYSMNQVSLMGASFLESMASKTWIDYGISGMEGFRKSLFECCHSYWGKGSVELGGPLSAESRRILGFSEEMLNYRVVGKGNTVEYYEEIDRASILVGTLNLSPLVGRKITNLRVTPTVKMWVTPQQTVFKDLEPFQFHS
jgi:hypothetical protein